jgi:hypothetical protein
MITDKDASVATTRKAVLMDATLASLPDAREELRARPGSLFA